MCWCVCVFVHNNVFSCNSNLIIPDKKSEKNEITLLCNKIFPTYIIMISFDDFILNIL